MTLEKAVEHLANYKEFAFLSTVIKSLREECIGEMHSADTSALQQLSGRIISYDQILQIIDHENLEKRHKDFM